MLFKKKGTGIMCKIASIMCSLKFQVTLFKHLYYKSEKGKEEPSSIIPERDRWRRWSKQLDSTIRSKKESRA